MDKEILEDFNRAYATRSPLFGVNPTRCVVAMADQLPGPSNVVDLGCGDGRDSIYLLSRGHTLTCIDLSKAGGSALATRAASLGFHERLTVRVESVMEWLPAPDSFDAAVGITIMDHLLLSEHEPLLSRLSRSLRRGGLVALEMHSDRDPSYACGDIAPSEFAAAIRSHATANYLLTKFSDGWRVLEYSDRVETDLDHGAPHRHGFASILAQRIS